MDKGPPRLDAPKVARQCPFIAYVKGPPGRQALSRCKPVSESV